MSMNEISLNTQDYFMKLPGYNTLRMVISKKSLLVEGPSDELIVQKAYLNLYRKLPIEDEIDVISVDSLAFKRFLEIAKKLKKEVVVITDNDGDIAALQKKYIDYNDCPNIKICYSKDANLNTLEFHLSANNSIQVLNLLLDKDFSNKSDLEHFMLTNKTEVALKIFEKGDRVVMPQYILDAIQK